MLKVTSKVTRSKLWYKRKGLVTTNVHVKYDSPTSNDNVFKYKGQRSRSRSVSQQILV